MKKIQEKEYNRRWKAMSQLKVLLQEYDCDSVYWKYLFDLQTRLYEKGFLFPSEYSKLDSWRI